MYIISGVYKAWWSGEEEDEAQKQAEKVLNCFESLPGWARAAEDVGVSCAQLLLESGPRPIAIRVHSSILKFI